MVGKLMVLVLGLGACSCILLATRQLCLQCGHDIAAARLRIREHDESLQRLRAMVAARTTPEEVERMAAALGEIEVMEVRRRAWEAARAQEGMAP